VVRSRAEETHESRARSSGSVRLEKGTPAAEVRARERGVEARGFVIVGERRLEVTVKAVKLSALDVESRVARARCDLLRDRGDLLVKVTVARSEGGESQRECDRRKGCAEETSPSPLRAASQRRFVGQAENRSMRRRRGA
jgi:hypothetical protein